MTAPSIVPHQRTLPPIGTAGNDGVIPALKVPVTGTISYVGYTPDAALSGANTNSRTLTLYNRGAAGSGTTVVAQLALTSGVNLVLDVEKVIPLSGTAANLIVTAGDILEWNSLHVGSGIVDPGGLLLVELTKSTATP